MLLPKNGAQPITGDARVGRGRYCVQALLGQGGMGAVYRVREVATGHAYALKRLTLCKDSPRYAAHAEWFAREYRTLSQLAHPSVIRVHDYGVDDEGPFYTMDLLGGADLHKCAPLPYREACQYFRDVASCLSLLHSRGLLHRDVTPRNVRCDGGRGMLIDFGAMAAMGPASEVIGTPALVAPEAIHHEPLDGRYDLFALGGTLYWALTGRSAYAARGFEQLPRVWEAPLVPPSEYVPDLPPELDELVLSLLSLQVDGRPRTAGDVMHRLTRIGGLDADEMLEVSQAYLVTPPLLGRADELTKLGKALAQVDGGSSLLRHVSGAPGVGRSRLLDVAATEGRVAGGLVLRVVGGGGFRRQRELLEGLIAQLPESALADRSTSELDDDVDLQLAWLGKAIAAVASERTVLITVDDAHLLAPSSQALLLALVRGVTTGLLVIVSEPCAAGATPSNSPWPDSARIRLHALTEAQISQLVVFLFGDVPGAAVVAAGVYGRSLGNPQAALQLVQHLVDTGRARYTLGGWVLPTTLTPADVPAAWTAVLDARIELLSSDGFEVAAALALSGQYEVRSEDLAKMTSHGLATRVEEAIDGLLAVGLVRREADAYVLPSAAHEERVRARLDEDKARDIYGKLAVFLAGAGRDCIDVARCFQHAGRSLESVDALLRAVAQGTRWETAPDDYGALLENALAVTRESDGYEVQRLRLIQEIIQVGAHLRVRGMRGYFSELTSRLVVDSGLQDWHRLEGQVPDEQRLQKAFERAQQRWEAQAEADRYMPPFEAVRGLALVCRQASAFGAVALEHSLLTSIPSLEPFAALSPALESSVKGTFLASFHLTAARYEEARECFNYTLDRLSQPDKAGLDDAYHAWATSALRFALGHIEAGLGIASALEYAKLLDTDENWAIGAWDVRSAYYQRYGDWSEAEVCRRQVEAMQMASPRRPPMVDTSSRLALDVASQSGNLTSARRAMERMKDLIVLHEGYAPYAHFGPASIALIEGNYASAAAHAERALELIVPGQHPTWPYIVSCLLRALLGLEQYDNARRRGLEFLESAERIGLGVMSDHVEIPLGLVEAKLGYFESAIERVDKCVDRRSGYGAGGLGLGWAYEARARIALMMGDDKAFEAAAAGCAREYGHGRPGSSLAVNYQALCTEARLLGMATPGSSEGQGDPGLEPAWAQTLDTLLAEGGSVEGRYTTALSVLVSEIGAAGGALYSVESGVPRRVASSMDAGLPEEVHGLVVASFRQANHDGDDDEFMTETGELTEVAPVDGPVEGWRAIVLADGDGAAYRVRALAAVHGGTSALPPGLCGALARYLQCAPAE